MVKNSQKTIYGLDLQMAMLTGMEYKIHPNTTLNEKFEILPTATLEEGVYPRLKYYTIGVGGTDILTGLEGYSYSKHKAIDAGLFEHVPFVLRRTYDDLLESEQRNYRFRKNVIINGIEYIAYYLKVINHVNNRDGFYEIKVENDIAKLSLFDTNTDKLLNPSPRDPSTAIEDNSETKYIAKVSKLQFSLYNDELVELNNVLNILYGEGHSKYLTEIGVCSGVDNDNDEATVVQINYHYEIDVETALTMREEGSLVRSLEIAGAEPLVLE